MTREQLWSPQYPRSSALCHICLTT